MKRENSDRTQSGKREGNRKGHSHTLADSTQTLTRLPEIWLGNGWGGQAAARSLAYDLSYASLCDAIAVVVGSTRPASR